MAVGIPTLLASGAAAHLKRVPTKRIAFPQVGDFEILIEEFSRKTTFKSVDAQHALASHRAALNTRSLGIIFIKTQDFE
ncbi:uncharacterized protein PFLUO_LOCUS5876 [Penicillium psychrofluorescens]|uniref:uncharacterized protein n=1 Tax=Penicillium psychrofluorescens TaxID=3158075 RepID=UPI003CCE4B21